MLSLAIEHQGFQDKLVPLNKKEIIIGRISECDITLSKCKEVSRRHAKIEFINNSYFLTDLESANGTILNGKPIKAGTQHPIQVNDEIILADEIKLRVTQADTTQAADSEYNASMIESLTNTSRVFSAQEILEVMEERDINAEEAPPDTRLVVQNRSKLLQILNRVEKELISIRPIDEYLKLVMDLVFEMLPADRGFLMQRNEDSGELEAKQIKFQKDAIIDSKQLLQHSRTIAQKVMEESVAILSRDAIMDDRFSDSDSIFFIGIRSAMCVPLWTKDHVLGVIYVDNLASSDNFSDDDLALLSAFANHAAIGIEQAQLHESILKERKIRSHLERYHSPEIVDRIEQLILKDKSEKIEPIVTDVSVLFADIVGFTSMLEKMQPLEISELLNEFYQHATNIIFRYNGTLDKFIGDSVMAIYGAPFALENDAERAVKSALELQEALRHVNQGRRPDRQIRLRIGINSGKVIAGDFGSYLRMEYTVLGDTVNTASRIESQIAAAGQIVVGESTYRITKNKIHYDYLGEFDIRGKMEKIKAYLAKSSVDDLHIY